jgi:hypothetical protein
MAARCTAVIRGAKKPLVVDFTSNIADASGAVPSELIPTFWANADAEISRAAKMVFSVFIFVCFELIFLCSLIRIISSARFAAWF